MSDMFTENSKEAAFLRQFGWVVITGGSSGIGAEFLKAISNIAPATGICNLSRSRPAGFTNAELQHHIHCDLEDRADLESAAERILDILEADPDSGRILVINNSGFGSYGEFPAPNPAHNAAMVDLNCRAPVLLTGLLWPEIRRRGGAIINVASLAGFQPTPYLSTYAASKAFVLNWSVGLDAEWRSHGVRALALCPGPTSTNFFRRAGFGEAPMPGGYGTTTEQVVRCAITALMRGDAKVVPGASNKCVAFVSSILPRRLVARLGRELMLRLRLKPLLP